MTNDALPKMRITSSIRESDVLQMQPVSYARRGPLLHYWVKNFNSGRPCVGQRPEVPIADRKF